MRSTPIARRVLVTGLLAAVVTVAALAPPSAGQDDATRRRADGGNAGDAEPEIPLAQWVEDCATLVAQPRMEPASPLVILGNEGGYGPNLVFEDEEPLLDRLSVEDIECLVSEWIDAALERRLPAIADDVQTLILILPGDQLVIRTAAAVKADIRAKFDALRQVAAAAARLELTPVTFSRELWSAFRARFRDTPALDPQALWAWLARAPKGTVTIQPARTSRAHSGERVRLTAVLRSNILRDFSVQTAVSAGFADPIIDSVPYGTTMHWRPWIVAGGRAVLVDLAAYALTALSMDQVTLDDKNVIDLPGADRRDGEYFWRAVPGRAYVLSTGPREGADGVEALIARITVEAPRPAVLEDTAIGGARRSRTVDVLDLLVPGSNADIPELSSRSQYAGIPPPPDESETPSAYDFQELPDILAELAGIEDAEAACLLAPEAYLTFIGTPAQLAAYDAALQLLRHASPASLATDVVIYRLSVAELARARKALAADRSPAAVARALGGEVAAHRTLIDATFLHRTGQRTALRRTLSRAYLGDHNIEAQANVTIPDAVVEVLDSGFALGVSAIRSGARWETTLTGVATYWDGTFRTHAYDTKINDKNPTRGGPIQLPRVAYVRLDASVQSDAKQWAVRRRADGRGRTHALLIFVRTRPVD